MAQLYSALPARRAGQIVADLVAVVVIALSVTLGLAVGALISSLSALGVGIEDAGRGLQGTMTDAADSLGAIPLIGSGASSPFRSASDAGATLVAAGQRQQDVVGGAALVIGIAVAALPILVVLLVWLRPRIRFARRAALSARLGDSPAGVELLALRALARSAPETLLTLTADPVAAWRAGDPRTIRALAALELRDAGVRSR